ncbi:hypothetical protein CXF72_19140 [Psychromonas sp. MB-3u-54]|uniref:hypothetical protein n=1 Tax=Psychromonas sp. MB-3u-54 TaxID=2058319 RepID=UPI000C32DAE0|nr:hypothetical protein [Psychromonas sp. MB-3u-54]PKH01048.1 hypothetical protein CXF72_19140 [Psychromonas sp. MB-3u-54]
MLSLLRFWKPFCTIVLFLVTALALPAMAQTLAPSEIDTLKAQLVKAQDVYSALGTRVQCYEKKDTSLQVRSSQLQKTAGDLHQQEQMLSSELAQAKSEAEEFNREFEAARQEMDKLQSKISNIEAQIQARQAALDDCKRKAWIFGFVCDIAGELAGLNGDLRRFSADRQAANIKAGTLDQQLRAAQIRQSQAAERFQNNQHTSDQHKQDIAAAEAEIKVIKASLSEIRTVKQDYSVKLGTFQDAFTEFEALDPSSARRSVVHRLLRESADLDALLVKARGVIERNGLQLPNGERLCEN